MFDTITGLPVHALVVHAVVVGMPAMSLVTFVVAARPSWRGALGWVTLLNLGLLGATYTARRSGMLLQNRLSELSGQTVAEEHGDYGIQLIWFALALVVASAVAWWVARREGPMLLAILLVAIAGIGATGWTVLTGDSGARAVWEDTIANTEQPAG